jgi:hypothetical protein
MNGAFKQEIPPDAARVLVEYGQLIAVGVGGILLMLIVLLVLKRMFRKAAPKADPEAGLRENLGDYPPPPPESASRRLLVHGLSARIRLIVVAPAGKQSTIDIEQIDGFLDQLVRGLGTIVQQDKPRVRLWPAQLSNRGFGPTFHRLVATPDPEGRPSRWVLVAGTVRLGKWQVLLGMALYAEKLNTLGRLTLEPDQWADTLRIQQDH